MVMAVQHSYNTLLSSSEAVFPFYSVKIFNKPIGDHLRAEYGDIFLPDFYDRSNKSRADFFPGILFQNSFWRQFNAGNEEVRNALYPTACSRQTYKILESLNKFVLDIIISKAIPDPKQKQRFLNPIPNFNIIKSILERRGMLLQNLSVVD